MFIHSLYYKDHSTGWTLGTPDEPMAFDRLTLLVGASGVGKSQSLKAILNLQKIIKGESLNGVEWSVVFCLANDKKYYWKGKFEESSESFSSISDVQKFKIESESLVCEQEELIARQKNEIFFNGKVTPKLSASESAVFLLKEEESVQIIFHEFRKIMIIESHSSTGGTYAFEAGNLDDIVSNFSDKKDIWLQPLRLAAYIGAECKNHSFIKLKNNFMSIFPLVEDIQFERVPISINTQIVVQIMIKVKEKGVKHWISEGRLSSGMLRVFDYLSGLYFCPNSTIILIDEFENSLGINCIDEVTSSILSQNRNLQFILTSHHPYIINHISSEHWKILTRKGSVVKAHNAKDVGIGKSKHAAFTQLINLDMYNTGMEE